MAQSLYARAASRGFPVFDVSGQSGQGALPDSTLPSGQQPGAPTASWTDPNVDPASVGAVPAPPEEYILGLGLWGLSATVNPDDTPRTHAAPTADPSLSWRKDDEAAMAAYAGELEAAHDPVFTGPAVRRDVGTVAKFAFGQQAAEGTGQTNLSPVPAAMRGQAGLDAVQGFGGGGPGPGGLNDDMPQLTLDRQFPGYTYHDVIVTAGEVPLYTADALQFIASEPALPAWTGGGFDVPTASVNAQDVISADVPLQGPAVAAPAGLLPLWGT